MSFKELEQMKARLLTCAVTSSERLVLLDMAVALDEGSTRYTWGHDRLALTLGKRPRTAAAKSALSQRLIPSLITKGFVKVRRRAQPGSHAEYELLILGTEWVAVSGEMGSGFGSGMGSGFGSEWVAVSGEMGSGQTATPPPPTTNTPPGGGHEHEANARRTLMRVHAERRLPIGVDELLEFAYRIGAGDPWAGWLTMNATTNEPLDDARDPAAVLRFRLEGAQRVEFGATGGCAVSGKYSRACHVGLVTGDFVVEHVARGRRIALRCRVCGDLLEADERNVLEDAVRCDNHDPSPGVDPGAYRRAHTEVRRVRGDPAEYPCIWCGRQGQEWAHDDAHDPDGVTSGGYAYSWSPDHYQPACIRHHRRAPYWRDRDAYGATTLPGFDNEREREA